ncbi:MAG: aldo/keto reductase [Pseudomonadota bacterium]|nr:aldo/keto reductase [Pseudomonadota bacterium]
MRYRPLGGGGTVVSAVSLRLRSDRLTPAQAVTRIHAAVEQGVNTFDIPGDDPEMLLAVGQALQSVDRELLVLVVRIGGSRNFGAHALQAQIVDALRRMRVARLDAVVLDDPAGDELTAEALDMLKAARASGRVRMLGVAGVDEAIDAYISNGAFDLLVLPFNLTTGWRERRRLLEASKRDMAVIGYDPWPEVFQTRPAGPAKASLLSRAFRSKPAEPLAGAGTYAFLENTANWSSEQICLAYALTDLKIATIQIEPHSEEHLAELAAIADREMPSGLSAQVEMARFAETA